MIRKISFPEIFAQNANQSGQFFMVFLIIGILIFILIILPAYFFKLWIRATMSGVRISIADIIGMKLRKVPPLLIIDSAIMAKKAGLNITINDIEKHYLAGGDVIKVISAMIGASETGMDFTWETAVAIDLSGRDVIEEVKSRINQKLEN